MSRAQSLYRCCTVTDPISKQKCGDPVSDILSTASTCIKHFRTTDLGSGPSLKRGTVRGGITKNTLGGPRNKTVKVSFLFQNTCRVLTVSMLEHNAYVEDI